MFHTISTKIANYLSENSQVPINKSRVRYGIEIFFITTFNILILFLVSFVLDVFIETLSFFISYVLLRSFAGGTHLSKSSLCTSFGMILMLGGALFASYIGQFLTISFTLIVVLITTILSYYYCYKFAPAVYEYRKFSVEKKIRLRKYSLIVVLIWGLSVGVLTFFVPLEFISAAIIGQIVQIWMITPNAYSFTRKLERFFERVIV